jgi:hypothetical protein
VETIYAVINNLHWSVQYLLQNVYATMIPGPKEPSLEQLNYVLISLKNNLMDLYISEPSFN